MARLRDPARLQAVRRSGLLDLAQTRLEGLTLAAVLHLRCDAAQVNILDGEMQHHVAATPRVAIPHGLARESGCKLVVETGQPVSIRDAALDDIACVLPWAGTWPGYLGVPIVWDGQPLGSFCALSSTPRAWTVDDERFLLGLAADAVALIDQP